MSKRKLFNAFFDRVIGHEGGYVNHPRDPGGETNWGVTKRTARANGYKDSMRHMSRLEAREIYYRAFWVRYGCDRFDPALAWQFFDTCVNHGGGNAARILQRAVNVADDGVLGDISHAAIAEMPLNDLLMRFNAARIRFYTRLSRFDTFGRGWSNRVAANLDYAAGDNNLSPDDHHYDGYRPIGG